MRIGIIGSGVAGLAAAWLLDGTHEVLLFEREGRIGGHAHTVTVDARGGMPFDLATQHFSEVMYPRMLKWLRRLDVATREFPVTATYYDKIARILLPLSCRASRLHVRHLLEPIAVGMMACLGAVMAKARSVEAAGDWMETVEDVVEGSFAPRRIKDAFLYPFLSAIAGATIPQTKVLSARAIFRYPALHAPNHPFAPYRFIEVEGGLRAYVERVASTLTTTTIHRGAEIRSVRASGGKLLLRGADGTEHQVDKVIAAAPAHAAASMMADTPDGAKLSAILRRFSYLQTVIALHDDPRLMPDDRRLWGAVNVLRGKNAHEFTFVRKTGAGEPVFKSWITNATTAPAKPFVVQEYLHPIMDREYYRAQQALASEQGKHGIVFAGSYTQDIDSHESGLRSAIDAVRSMDPRAPRLREFDA